MLVGHFSHLDFVDSLLLRPDGSKIVLVGPICQSRVLRGGMAPDMAAERPSGGGCGRGKVELSYCSGGHRKQSDRARLTLA